MYHELKCIQITNGSTNASCSNCISSIIPSIIPTLLQYGQLRGLFVNAIKPFNNTIKTNRSNMFTKTYF